MSARRFLPGVATPWLGALLARALGQGTGFNHLLLAIALGFVLANGLGVPNRLEPGFGTHGIWLGPGIVLMGASITFDTLLDVGGRVDQLESADQKRINTATALLEQMNLLTRPDATKDGDVRGGS